jgi:hypothetical protein
MPARMSTPSPNGYGVITGMERLTIEFAPLVMIAEAAI